MMDRISTSSSYGAVVTNLMAAEVAQNKAGNQLSTTEVSTDLQGYGAGAETLTAMQTTNTNVNGYLQQTSLISAKLSTQDSALNQVADAADGVTQTVTSALADNSGGTLMQSLQTYFQNAVAGLNTTYNGEYMFAGGQVNTQPVSATSLTALATATPISGVFNNDQFVGSTQINSNTTVQTGFLASAVGTPLFTALQNISAYNQGPNGPFTGNLTAAQTTFLQGQLANLQTVHSNLVNVVGQNGLLQTQVTATTTSLTSQQTMLTGLIGNITDANLAQASTNLQEAQLAVQAAGQVFASLRASSLVNILPVA